MEDLIRDVLGDPLFMGCALVSLAGALTVVIRRNPVYCALGLMAAFLSFAVIFLKLSAPFLAAMHVLVYTGAILVLFLFVIMLLNLSDKELGLEHPRRVRAAVGVMAAALFGLVAYVAAQDARLQRGASALSAEEAKAWGGVEHVGMELFTKWELPFELISLLIVVAILGAVVLAKKKLPPEA